MSFKVGDKFTLTADAAENYALNKSTVFTVSHKATNRNQHPGFDESAGSPLYDSNDLLFSVYEWEMERA